MNRLTKDIILALVVWWAVCLTAIASVSLMFLVGYWLKALIGGA